MRRAAGVLLLLSMVVVSCAKKGEEAGAGGGKRPDIRFPVEVVPVAARRVEYSVSAVGSVEAFESVEVTARVPGAVERIHFSEGKVVEPGTLLVEIEPERYRLAVRSAKASLDKSLAAKAEAEAGLARRVSVNEKNPALVKEEDLDSWRTRVRTAEAEAAQARSAVELAELNLKEAFARAPVFGTIQTRNVRTGQYVQPGTVLATLVRREPLLVRFQVPAPEAARVRPGMAVRFSVGETGETYSAQITHVAASANEASRMVRVTAEVDDPKRARLRPGAFAQVTIPVGGASNAPVIPQTAVRPSERGFLAYVVRDGVAHERVLTLGMRTADGRVEVTSGVEPGENLVVRGAEALRDGAAVVLSGETAPGTAPGSRPEAAS